MVSAEHLFEEQAHGDQGWVDALAQVGAVLANQGFRNPSLTPFSPFLPDLGPQREAALNRAPTRLTLPAQSIDDAIAAGFDAARGNPSLKTYLKQRINARPRP